MRRPSLWSMPVTRRDAGVGANVSAWAAAFLLCGVWNLVAAAAPAEAGTRLCVTCAAPDVTYVCTAPEGLEKLPETARKRALSYVCARQIAQVHGHRSCRVQVRSDFPCRGKRFVVSALPKAAPPPSTMDADNSRDPAKSKDATARKEPRKDRPPKTVVELAKRTAEASKKGLDEATGTVKKAGETITDTVTDTLQQSWTCLSSLFNDC